MSRGTAEWRDSLVEIIPGLYLLPGQAEGRFPFAHSFVVEGDARALIDTGAGTQRLQSLRDQSSLDMLMASHSHPDHTAGKLAVRGPAVACS
jgi:glyoxylase-like metal-dependent hydrolase (beta-lactamase superfamily II)